MFALPTKADFGTASPTAQIYCCPACFADRPHELNDACLRAVQGAPSCNGWTF